MKGIEGLTLGRYELRRRVARGGMAEVYVAYDRRVRRQVAIKVLYGRDESFVRRFEREALAVGALSHDHILPLYDFGEQSPWYYLVMPYVAGGTLRDYLHRRKRLTLEEAASFLDQIASALQHAHDHGVVHRDVKPSNILLRPDGYAYLADFGLAKAIMGGDALTSDGTIVGTPEYMAPEQSNGANDYRSDIYSLGVILFQMLTGRVPFSADSPVAIFLRHIQSPPPSPREFNSDITPAIEEVMLKALAKDPNIRYQEAREFASAYWKALQQPQVCETRTEPPTSPTGSANELEAPPVDEDTTEPGLTRLASENTFIVPADERNMVYPPPTPRLFPLTTPVDETEPGKPSEPSPTYTPRPGRRLRPLYLVIAALVVLALLVPFGLLWHAEAQQAGRQVPLRASPSQQRATPDLSATTQAQVQATQAARSRAQATAGITSSVGAGNVLYSFDLKSPGGGWTNYGSQCFFSSQGYHVQTNGPHEAAWCFSSKQHFADAVITVQAQLLRGGFYGLIFRLEPNAPSLYVLEINNQGSYRFVRASGNNPQGWLTLIDWTSSSAILPGYGSTNTLMILAQGSSFRFYINRQLVMTSFTDSAYSAGLIGCLVGGDNTGGSEAIFSNVWVFQK